MRIRRDPPLHLTYCLNVHPGETWAENFAAVREKALRVKALVGRPGPFGLGLRLGGIAARTLSAPAAIAEFRAFCDASELYVFTVNGFPYGRFHGTSVKENVYRPDWRQPERLAYTNQLTDILAALLPEGVRGSISTLPGSYKAWIKTRADVRTAAGNIAKRPSTPGMCGPGPEKKSRSRLSRSRTASSKAHRKPFPSSRVP